MKTRIAMKRTPHLTDQDIERILGILDGWRGKLTWEFLIAELRHRRMRTYTRQALDRHRPIKAAFTAAKARLRQSPAAIRRQGPVELEKALERNQRLEAESQRLRLENDRLVEQFIRWAYNAHLKGCSEEYLNRPLPQIYREASKV